tara:strand:- start:252 stop:1349 length:1098 start_codon:yes stop_codon:yes gene_type:complete
MKIIYDHKIFWSQKYGGISRYFVNIIKNMQKYQKIDFKIIAPFYQNTYLKNEIKREKIIGIHLKKKIPKTSFLFEKFNNFFFKHAVHNYKPSLIHSTYYNESINKKNIPLIITVYDLIHEKLAIKKNNEIFPKFKSLMMADHIISISKKTKDDLIKFYNINENKISVVYLGSNHALSNADEYKAINKQKPYILYVGSREKYKNFEFFLKGYSFSEKLKKDFNIVLFGGGKLTNNERKIISELKLDNKVIHKEGNDKELYQLYRSSKVFIFPSIYEGFGLPLVEAMANECPVICSKNQIFEEIAGEAAEYFDPTNLENFKEKVEEVIYSNSRIKELKLLGKNKSENYSWEKCTNETLKIYDKFKIK